MGGGGGGGERGPGISSKEEPWAGLIAEQKYCTVKFVFNTMNTVVIKTVSN